MKENSALQQREIAQRRTILESRPSIYNIELTGRCNCKPACVFCHGKNVPGYVEPGDLDLNLLEAFSPYFLASERINDCSYGEPLLYPYLKFFVRKLALSKCLLGFSTNGVLLTGEKSRFLLKHIGFIDMIISVNASTPTTYHKLHGQKFHRLLKNIGQFIAQFRGKYGKRTLPVTLSYIVMQVNREEVLDFLRLAISLGVERVMLRHLFDLGLTDYVCDNFGHKFVYDKEMLSFEEYKDIENRIVGNREFSSLTISYQWHSEASFIAEHAQKDTDIPCLFPWKFLCIRHLHDIYSPCVFIKKGIGAPSRSSIGDIWNGRILVEMRKALASGRIPDFCLENSGICPLILEQEVSE